MFCVMCAIDIFLNKIMKSKFCVKKCQENVLQFMFLYIIRTPLLELKSVGKSADYTRERRYSLYLMVDLHSIKIKQFIYFTCNEI